MGWTRSVPSPSGGALVVPVLYLTSVLLAPASCASVPPPREQVSQAREQIRSARDEQVSQFAPLAIRQAEEELEAAEVAMREERNVDARRHAEIAKARAELALAKAEQGQNEEAIKELRATVDALNETIRRDRIEDLGR